MAKVVRLAPGGGAAVEESGLSVEQAKRLAAHLAAAGEPRGYCWCVGLDEEERVRDEFGEEAPIPTRAKEMTC